LRNLPLLSVLDDMKIGVERYAAVVFGCAGCSEDAGSFTISSK